MRMFRQLAHAMSIPIAMGLFLFAAQVSGGFELRDSTVASLAMK